MKRIASGSLVAMCGGMAMCLCFSSFHWKLDGKKFLLAEPSIVFKACDSCIGGLHLKGAVCRAKQ
jgi:hypothetical protein